MAVGWPRSWVRLPFGRMGKPRKAKPPASAARVDVVRLVRHAILAAVEAKAIEIAESARFAGHTYYDYESDMCVQLGGHRNDRYGRMADGYGVTDVRDLARDLRRLGVALPEADIDALLHEYVRTGAIASASVRVLIGTEILSIVLGHADAPAAEAPKRSWLDDVRLARLLWDWCCYCDQDAPQQRKRGNQPRAVATRAFHVLLASALGEDYFNQAGPMSELVASGILTEFVSKRSFWRYRRDPATAALLERVLANVLSKPIARHREMGTLVEAILDAALTNVHVKSAA